tara:strand:+ start:406 stop:759 length:354 start_codon:yes stop_codon:yes gene_type:complete
MAFKMKGVVGFHSSGTPIVHKDLGKNVVGEANKDGSIFLDKDIKNNPKLQQEAIAHEKVHLDQMRRGDLDYDDKNVYWKGKAYPRKKMKEGAKSLPWEAEAYEKTRRKYRNGKRRRR